MGEKTFPEQHQDQQPGRTEPMHPEPEVDNPSYRGSGKLEGEVALITGGDSGIGRAVAIHLAREGADVAIVYLEEDEDAQDTKRMVEDEGQTCLIIPGDVGEPDFCQLAVRKTIEELGRLDILINNAAEQHPTTDLSDLTPEQVERTFRTNIFSMFEFVRAAESELVRRKGRIINTTSVTAYRGSPHLIDYSATKGAITTFTRSLAINLAERGVRVNGVAPGPIWTPLIPSTFGEEHVSTFGANTPLGRAGQPREVAPAFVYLASGDSSYVTGQVIHVNGGEVING